MGRWASMPAAPRSCSLRNELTIFVSPKNIYAVCNADSHAIDEDIRPPTTSVRNKGLMKLVRRSIYRCQDDGTHNRMAFPSGCPESSDQQSEQSSKLGHMPSLYEYPPNGTPKHQKSAWRNVIRRDSVDGGGKLARSDHGARC